MTGLIICALVVLLGLWAFPYIINAIDPVVDVITGLFPTMNDYLLLLLVWRHIIIIGLIAFVVISIALNLARSRR